MGQPGESTEAQLRVLQLRWRGIAAALPALALLGGGLALAGSGAPEGPTRGAGASVTHGAALPVVPTTPFAMPGTADGAGGVAPGLAPTGPGLGPGAPVTLDAQGIPGPALAAYHRAAGVIGNADPACHIDWALIAAIGRVESDHGRYDGNVLDGQGIDSPGHLRHPARRPGRHGVDPGHRQRRLRPRHRLGPRGRPDAVHPRHLAGRRRRPRRRRRRRTRRTSTTRPRRPRSTCARGRAT